MRALFSLVGLLVVVAIVMLIARKQLHAVAPALPAAPHSAEGAAPTPTLPERSRGTQQRVLQDINQSLQQGAERAADSKP